MTEVLLRFERPASMTAELRAWVSQRARAGHPSLALRRLDGSDRAELLLRVEIPSESTQTAEQELADLMLDMRLLGLRPTVLSPRG